MKAQIFEDNSHELLDHCWNLMFGKAKEYASDEDRLSNFKQPTSLFGVSPAKVCLFWDAKHIASMVKIAEDAERGIMPSKELLLEKCSDYINYGVLFYSIMLELIEGRQESQS